MATLKGRAAVSRYMAQLPEQIVAGLLRGAGRTAANVIAEEARDRSISTEVASAVKVKVKRDGFRVVAKIQVKGKGAYIAPWLEYGTAPHFISVDASQRRGMSVGRINDLAKEEGSSHSLVIGGKFVGATVFHPGARPHPFLRPALDAKGADAVKAAQSYINSQISKGRIKPAAPEAAEG